MITDAISRILLVARHTAGEAARQKYLFVAALLAVTVAGLSVSLSFFDFGDSELKFITDLGFGALFLFGSMLAVVLTTHLFFAELENRTALTVLARPLRRWEFLTGKWLGVCALLGVMAVAVLGVTAVMAATRHAELAALAESAGRPAPRFEASGFALAALLQWVRLGVVSALTLFVCSYARGALFAYGAAFGLLLAGQTVWVAAEWAEERAGRLGLIFHAVPDLQCFDLATALIFPGRTAPVREAWMAVPYGLAWAGVLLALAAWCFRRREI